MCKYAGYLAGHGICVLRFMRFILPGYVGSILEKWERLSRAPSLNPPKTRAYHLLSGLLIVLALLAAGHMRFWQYDQWQADKDTYFVGDIAAFSTTDAPYFLLHARGLKTPSAAETLDRLRNYPDNVLQEQTAKTTILETPLLAVLISTLASDSTLSSLFSAAHSMLPMTAMVTALAVILAFGAAGYWTEGAFAAMGSSLSGAYLGRTSAGRIDTDQLNLGFFYLITGLIIWAGKSRNLWAALTLCIFAGICVRLFNWWWPKPILSWIFLGALIWVSLWCHRNWKRTLLLGTALIVTSGNLSFGLRTRIDTFVDGTIASGQLSLPNTFGAISELERYNFAEICDALMQNIWLAGFAAIGIAAWAFTRPMIAAVFMPALALGMMNFVFGNRVIFFAAPLFWFGFAWLGMTMFRHISQTRSVNIKTGEAINVMAAMGLFAFAYLASFNPITRPHVPKPVFPVEVLQAFISLGDDVRALNDDRQAVIATWWDYGYAAHLFSEIPAIHDGGYQRTAKTHLVARALLSTDQGEAARILKFIANEGVAGVIEHGENNDMLNEAMFGPIKEERAAVYVALSHQMASWMPSISAIGLWDMDTGTPTPIFNGSNRLHYHSIYCTGPYIGAGSGVGSGTGSGPGSGADISDGDAGPMINCDNKIIDLIKGTVDGRAVLSGAVDTNNGIKGTLIDYPSPTGLYLQFNRLHGQAWQDQLVHPRLYETAYNQLFYHGNFDPALFTPVMDAYPYFRVYRIN